MKKFLVPVNANEKRRLSELEDERRADRQQRFAERAAEIAESRSEQQQNPLPSNPPQQPESSDSERSAGEESEGDEAESEESSDEGSGNNSSSD
jgi:hypothetical protein